jgi:hypothetical protein
MAEIPKAAVQPDDTGHGSRLTTPGTVRALRIGFEADTSGCRIATAIDTLTPIR